MAMESSSINLAASTATITFDIDTDADLAAVEVQNCVAGRKPTAGRGGAERHLGRETGVEQPLTITLLSSDPKFDEIYLSNYATLNVLDMLRRVPGVGSVSNVGSRYYAMQIWVLPDRLANLGLTVQDLQRALKDQNRESAAGVLGRAAHDRSRCDDPHYGAGAFVVGGRVRGDRRPRQPRRLDHPPARRGARCS